MFDRKFCLLRPGRFFRRIAWHLACIFEAGRRNLGSVIRRKLRAIQDKKHNAIWMPTSECERRPPARTGTEHKFQYAKEIEEQYLRRGSVLVEALWKISCRKSCTVLHSRRHAVGVHTMHNHCSVSPLPHKDLSHARTSATRSSPRSAHRIKI